MCCVDSKTRTVKFNFFFCSTSLFSLLCEDKLRKRNIKSTYSIYKHELYDVYMRAIIRSSVHRRVISKVNERRAYRILYDMDVIVRFFSSNKCAFFMFSFSPFCKSKKRGSSSGMFAEASRFVCGLQSICHGYEIE